MNRKSVLLSLAAPMLLAWSSVAAAQDRFAFTMPTVSLLPAGVWKFAPIDFPSGGGTDLLGSRDVGSPLLVAGTNTGSGFTFENWPAGPLVVPGELQVADFTADGATDLFVYTPSSGSIQVGTRNGNAFQFSTWSVVSPAANWSFAIGDFSGDGRADLMGYYAPLGTLFYGLNTGSSIVWSAAGQVFPAGGWLFAAGNFTGAATSQVAGYHPSNDSLWLLSNVSGTFSSSLWGYTTAGGWQVDQLLADDFDQDGRSDVFGYDAASGELIVGVSTGTSFGVTRWGAVPAVGTWRFVTGGFTGTSKPDLVGFEASTQQLWFAENVLGACNNGIDDDSDGLIDHPADPGCRDGVSTLENPACNDGLDNDGDGGIDFNGGPGLLTPDVHCATAYRNKETPNSGCGLGGEVVVVGAALLRLFRHRRA